MIETWYAFVSFLLIAYVVTDGRNFGAGMLYQLVAKTPEERRQVVAAVEPLYHWHIVWLISFGGTLFAIFPRVLASAFAGYYLALFLILWCFVLRGVALDVGVHLTDRLWQTFWNFVLVLASALLAVLFGVAGGNLARGIPLDAQGDFSMAFFTDFGVRGHVGLLDWYTLSIAVFATVMLAAHGATYLKFKTVGPVHDRSATYAKWLWLAIPPLLLIVSTETLYVRPDLVANGIKNPFVWLGVLVVAAAALTVITGIRQDQEERAVIASTILIGSMLATGAAGLFPIMLYSTLAPQNSMTAYASASAPGSLVMAFIWWPIAIILTFVYYFYVARHYAGKIAPRTDL
jgi:cytochrome bd ubiquinol oxidase subunit II